VIRGEQKTGEEGFAWKIALGRKINILPEHLRVIENFWRKILC
jgi:hypothetical protein